MGFGHNQVIKDLIININLIKNKIYANNLNGH